MSYKTECSWLAGITQCTQLTGLTVFGSVTDVLPSKDVIARLPLLELKLGFSFPVVFPTTLTRLEISYSRNIDLRSLTRLLFLDVDVSYDIIAPLQLQGLVAHSYSSISNVKDLHLQQVLCPSDSFSSFEEFTSAKHAEKRNSHGVCTLLSHDKDNPIQVRQSRSSGKGIISALELYRTMLLIDMIRDSGCDDDDWY